MNQIKTRSFALYIGLLVLGGIGWAIMWLGFMAGAFGLLLAIIGLALGLACGLFCIVMLYNMMKDINVMCESDGEELMNYILALLLGMITFGIYLIYYYYRVQTRLHENSRRFNVEISESGGTFLLWYLAGSLLFGLGPIIAMAIMFRSFNKLAYGYNQFVAGNHSIAASEKMELSQNGQVIQAMPLPQNMESTPDDTNDAETVAVRDFYLRCDDGIYKGGEFDLPDGATISIGRDYKSVNLVLEEEGVSRTHSIFSRQRGQVFVEDLSTNGTFVNGERIVKGKKINLTDGDKVQIGKTDHIFTVKLS